MLGTRLVSTVLFYQKDSCGYVFAKMATDFFKVIVLVLTLLGLSKSKLSPQECRSLGLSPNLLCGSCDDLKQFKLERLIESCRNCCEADEDEKAGKVSMILRFTKSRKAILLFRWH